MKMKSNASPSMIIIVPFRITFLVEVSNMLILVLTDSIISQLYYNMF